MLPRLRSYVNTKYALKDFDTLLINHHQQIGIILKHATDQTIFVSASDDKELRCLALIAADAFNLKKMIVAKLWANSNASDLGDYRLSDLHTFREELKTFLKHIQRPN
jgi:hypothetical protein